MGELHGIGDRLRAARLDLHGQLRDRQPDDQSVAFAASGQHPGVGRCAVRAQYLPEQPEGALPAARRPGHHLHRQHGLGRCRVRRARDAGALPRRHGQRDLLHAALGHRGGDLGDDLLRGHPVPRLPVVERHRGDGQHLLGTRSLPAGRSTAASGRGPGRARRPATGVGRASRSRRAASPAARRCAGPRARTGAGTRAGRGGGRGAGATRSRIRRRPRAPDRAGDGIRARRGRPARRIWSPCRRRMPGP